MNNTNQHLYTIYKNIQSFYGYRKLVPLDTELNQDQFIKKVQGDKFIVLAAVNKSDVIGDNGDINKQKLNPTGKKVTVILLVYPGTECESKRANMIKLLNHVQYESAEVIIVTPTKISAGVTKGLNALLHTREYANYTFKAFTYTLFNSVLPEHELVPKYEILSDDQINELKQYCIEPTTLPKVFENDPQMVWIGAKVGNVVKFVYLSEVTIETIGYCIVIPNM
jgi:DNA-directed RNA polymerase subunit H (RpoH/RPB5)